MFGLFHSMANVNLPVQNKLQTLHIRMGNVTGNRLAKNVGGGANQNIGRKGGLTESIGVSQLWGAHAWAAPPKSTPMKE